MDSDGLATVSRGDRGDRGDHGNLPGLLVEESGLPGGGAGAVVSLVIDADVTQVAPGLLFVKAVVSTDCAYSAVGAAPFGPYSALRATAWLERSLRRASFCCSAARLAALTFRG